MGKSLAAPALALKCTRALSGSAVAVAETGENEGIAEGKLENDTDALLSRRKSDGNVNDQAEEGVLKQV